MRILALALMLPLAAHAAETADCQTYATRTSSMALRALLIVPWVDVATGRWLYNKAYFYCLNSDEVPPLVFTPEEQPIVDDALPAPVPRPETAAPPSVGKSGAAAGSAEWKAWCRQNFPRSWDEATGTVILPTSRKRTRTQCPG